LHDYLLRNFKLFQLVSTYVRGAEEKGTRLGLGGILGWFLLKVKVKVGLRLFYFF
jgi:hypothetical protein